MAKLNELVKRKLINVKGLGWGEGVFKQIESSPTLLRLLESYAGSINIGAAGEGTYTKFEKIIVNREEIEGRSVV